MTKTRKNYGGLSAPIPRLPLNPVIWKKYSSLALGDLTADPQPERPRRMTLAELDELKRAIIQAHENDLRILESLRPHCVERRLTLQESGRRVGSLKRK